MPALLKNYRKRKIDDTKDENLYVDCILIFGSIDRRKRLFSHCKYIKT